MPSLIFLYNLTVVCRRETCFYWNKRKLWKQNQETNQFSLGVSEKLRATKNESGNSVYPVSELRNKTIYSWKASGSATALPTLLCSNKTQITEGSVHHSLVTPSGLPEASAVLSAVFINFTSVLLFPLSLETRTRSSGTSSLYHWHLKHLACGRQPFRDHLLAIK